MLDLLTGVLPLGVAAGVSPMMFTQQTLLVLGRRGVRNATWYLVGVAAVAAALILATGVVGAGLQLPRAPRLNAVADLVLGAAIVLLAAWPRWWRRRPAREVRLPRRTLGPAGSLAYGLFSMATNFTSQPILVVAAKDVMVSGQHGAARALALLLLLVLSCLPAVIPLVGVTLAGPAARRPLEHAGRFVQTHSMRLVLALIIGVGILLMARGVGAMLGLATPLG